MAFAGWLGLLITAMNLVPAGQLDGGHISQSLFGSRVAGVVSRLTTLVLFALALTVWPMLMTWALIVFFMSGRGAPPLNDVTPLTPGRKLLAATAFVLLALMLIPMPDAGP
jgi:membrane-associated protease RseP (regulator of RpoE activity)